MTSANRLQLGPTSQPQAHAGSDLENVISRLERGAITIAAAVPLIVGQASDRTFASGLLVLLLNKRATAAARSACYGHALTNAPPALLPLLNVLAKFYSELPGQRNCSAMRQLWEAFEQANCRPPTSNIASADKLVPSGRSGQAKRPAEAVPLEPSQRIKVYGKRTETPTPDYEEVARALDASRLEAFATEIDTLLAVDIAYVFETLGRIALASQRQQTMRPDESVKFTDPDGVEWFHPQWVSDPRQQLELFAKQVATTKPGTEFELRVAGFLSNTPTTLWFEQADKPGTFRSVCVYAGDAKERANNGAMHVAKLCDGSFGLYDPAISQVVQVRSGPHAMYDILAQHAWAQAIIKYATIDGNDEAAMAKVVRQQVSESILGHAPLPMVVDIERTTAQNWARAYIESQAGADASHGEALTAYYLTEAADGSRSMGPQLPPTDKRIIDIAYFVEPQTAPLNVVSEVSEDMGPNTSLEAPKKRWVVFDKPAGVAMGPEDLHRYIVDAAAADADGSLESALKRCQQVRAQAQQDALAATVPVPLPPLSPPIFAGFDAEYARTAAFSLAQITRPPEPRDWCCQAVAAAGQAALEAAAVAAQQSPQARNVWDAYIARLEARSLETPYSPFISDSEQQQVSTFIKRVMQPHNDVSHLVAVTLGQLLQHNVRIWTARADNNAWELHDDKAYIDAAHGTRTADLIYLGGMAHYKALPPLQNDTLSPVARVGELPGDTSVRRAIDAGGDGDCLILSLAYLTNLYGYGTLLDAAPSDDRDTMAAVAQQHLPTQTTQLQDLSSDTLLSAYRLFVSRKARLQIAKHWLETLSGTQRQDDDVKKQSQRHLIDALVLAAGEEEDARKASWDIL